MASCRLCGNRLDPNQPNCPACGTPVGKVLQPEDLAPQRGMKFFKFLIYFFLWAEAVGALLTGLRYLFGNALGPDTQYIYSEYPQISTTHIGFGIFYIAYAAFAIFTRFALARYRAIGPKLLIAYYALDLAAELMYFICMMSVGTIRIGFFSAIGVKFPLGAIIFDAVMIYEIAKYFRKREHLFIK